MAAKMYKDKDKQRAATRERVRRYRAKHKDVTLRNAQAQTVTPDDVTPKRAVMGVTMVDPAMVKLLPECSLLPSEIEEPEPQSYSPLIVGYVPPGRT